MPIGKRALAEFLGTFWLVFGGCGSAVLAAAFPQVGIGLLGVSFAFGLTVLTMAYAIGHISGCHLNPAVTAGLIVAKRFPLSEAAHYIIAQVLGGIAGAGILYGIASGTAGFSLAAGFASNGFGPHSPGGYSMESALLAEVVLTFMFLMIILGSTDKRAPSGFAPIGLVGSSPTLGGIYRPPRQPNGPARGRPARKLAVLARPLTPPRERSSGNPNRAGGHAPHRNCYSPRGSHR